MMVKFDGRVKAGPQLYEQKGAALHLKVSDIDMTVRGLTRLVEKRSCEMGVSSSFVLTDAHGFQLSRDTCGPTDLRASSKKILACLKSNYEKHFGGSSETLATLLADSPDVRAEKSSQKLDVSAPLGKRRRLFDEETSTASPGSFSLPDKVDQVAADTASILRILSEADMAWIVDVLLYDLRVAFTCCLCSKLVVQPVVCPDCREVVGCATCVETALCEKPVCPKNPTHTSFMDKQFMLRGFNRLLQTTAQSTRSSGGHSHSSLAQPASSVPSKSAASACEFPDPTAGPSTKRARRTPAASPFSSQHQE